MVRSDENLPNDLQSQIDKNVFCVLVKEGFYAYYLINWKILVSKLSQKSITNGQRNIGKVPLHYGVYKD